jgi:hypothetical protein
MQKIRRGVEVETRVELTAVASVPRPLTNSGPSMTRSRQVQSRVHPFPFLVVTRENRLRRVRSVRKLGKID